MLIKIFIPIFVILLVAMVAFIFWPQSISQSKISSLSSALSEAKEIECNYVDGEGLKTKTSLKKGMLRSDFSGSTPESAGAIIIRDDKTYVWWIKDKEGFFAASADDNAKQKEQVINDMERYKESCKPAKVSDSLFIVPSDVHFRDFFQDPTPTPVN